MSTALLIGLWSGVVTAAAGTAAWMLWRSRRDPGERERRRRALITARGRLIEGIASDFCDGIVFYSYQWRGVEYEASQDLRALAPLLPEQHHLLIGPVTVKFLPSDPSNSIVMSETWCGFPRLRSLTRTGTRSTN